MKYVLYALLIWFLYQFIFKLVIPVYRASRKIKQGFREMQERMASQNQQYQQQAYSSAGAAPKAGSSSKASGEDYIDFEEVK